MIKNLLIKNIYTKGISIGVLFLLTPFLLGLVFWIMSQILPEPCSPSDNCGYDEITGIIQSLQFGLAFFAIPLMLLGTLIITIFTFAYGVHTLRQSSNHPLRKTKILLGGLSGVLLLYLVYIPGGPDQCSRVITDSQYERCLTKLFSNMTVDEARDWLEESGYRITSNYSGSSSTLIMNYYKTERLYKHDFTFTGYRSYGRGNSIPYGTNFNRLFGRMWPAPTSFEMVFFGIKDKNLIFGAKASWSFSFL